MKTRKKKMSPLAIFSQYGIFAIALFAFYVNHTHSFPDVPGREFKECYKLEKVINDHQSDGNYEDLRLAETGSKITNICLIADTEDMQDELFCLVVESNGNSICYEFRWGEITVTYFKYPNPYLEFFAFRDVYVRWHLFCEFENYEKLGNFYIRLRYLTDSRNMKTLAIESSSLQRRNKPNSDYQPLATEPLIMVDEDDENFTVIHIYQTRGDVVGPVLIIWKGRMKIFAPDDNKVYMSLNAFPQELYFFTCPTPDDASYLSDELSPYGDND